MVSTAPLAAGSQPTRVHLIDALRGFALAGILIVNIGYFASAWHGSGIEDPGFAGNADRVATFAVAALAETKFYLLFSFLFGYSFTIQLESAAQAGRPFRAPFLRRLAALATIGAGHAVLLFAGDILVTYALMGLVLLALSGRTPRKALRLALLVLAGVALAYALIALAEPPALDPGAIAADARAGENGYTAGPASVIEARVSDLPDVAALLLLFQAPTALAMFLIGLAAGKRKLLHRAAEHIRLWSFLRLWGLAFGLPGGVLYAWGSSEGADHPQRELLTLAADVLLAPALTAGLTATMVLWMLGPRGGMALSALAPAGRMALTNYIGQSVAMALAFTGYGAALMGRVGPLAIMPIAATIFAVQLLVSRRWMGRHRYGPLEWLVRWATAGRRPAWRAGFEPAATQRA